MADLDIHDLPALLAFIPSDSRDAWVRVGMGLRAEFGDAAFDAWDAWSADAACYNAREARTVWASFRRDGVGFGSVVALARQGGWQPEKRELTAAEKRAREADRRARAAAREAAVEADAELLAAMNEAVAAACLRVWREHADAVREHPYLSRKRVLGYGLRVTRHSVLIAVDCQARTAQVWAGGDVQRFFEALPSPRPDHLSFVHWRAGTLLVPLLDADGKMWSLQSISADGKKLFPKFSRKRGCLFVLPGADDVVAVAEGYATAATIHEATGWTVAVAFDAGSMLPVALALRGKYPQAQFVICGDDDTATPGNPGRKAAQAAADAVSGVCVLPDFSVMGVAA